MYPYFPEEQNSEVAAFLSTFSEDRNNLYIHRNGLLRFSNAINNERVKIISKLQNENPEEYDLLLAKKLSPERSDELKFQTNTVAFLEIMSEYGEIITTVNMLHDAHTYLNDFPNSTDYAVSRYIRYHLSNHFNEFFILSERLGSLLKIVQRLYRKDERFYKFNTHFSSMKNIQADTFKRIRRERNYHVHEKRYTDADLEELETIEFDIYFDISASQVINPLYLEKLEKYKKHVLEMVKGVNDTTDELLDIFFGILERFLFTEQGEFQPPRESRKRH